jgi:hypothetical protein
MQLQTVITCRRLGGSCEVVVLVFVLRQHMMLPHDHIIVYQLVAAVLVYVFR